MHTLTPTRALLALIALAGSTTAALAQQPAPVQPAPQQITATHTQPVRARVVPTPRRIVAFGHTHLTPGTRSVFAAHRLRDPDVGINGRPWISRPIVNDDAHQLGVHAHHEARSHEEPGSAAYGAAGEDLRLALVRVNTLAIGISPWQRIEPQGLKRLENARNQWLVDRGYLLGVRTFRNDQAIHHHHAQHNDDVVTVTSSDSIAPAALPTNTPTYTPPGQIEPRATFRIAPETPRFRKRMQVLRPEHGARWVLAPAASTTGTVGPAVATIRGEAPASPVGHSSMKTTAQAPSRSPSLDVIRVLPLGTPTTTIASDAPTVADAATPGA